MDPANHSLQAQIQQQHRLQTEPQADYPTEIKRLIYQNTKSFFLTQLQKAKENNKINESDNSKPLSLAEVIKKGLELQEYMGKYTNFYKLYLQEIKSDYVNYNARKKQFVSKAKLMIKLFLKKHKNSKCKFYLGVDWVKLGDPSYPLLIDQPITIQEIMQKLIYNRYPKEEDFYMEMDKMFEDFMFYNFKNEAMMEIGLKFKDNWEIIKYKVLQLQNFANRSFLNPSSQLMPEMMNIDAEINRLKRKVSIWNNKTEELEYDPNFYERNGIVREGNQISKDSHNSKQKFTSPVKSQSRPKFESYLKGIKGIEKERVLKLKADVTKRIGIEVADKNKNNKKLLQYIREKAKIRPSFLGKNQEINLELLEYDEIIQLQNLTQKYLNET